MTDQTRMTATATATGIARAQAEEFLYHEAELLDDWRLPEWAALFAEGGIYEVTAPGSADPGHADAATELFLVADPVARIRGRAERLMKKTAHAEFPRSKTRHCISNVRIVASTDGDARVRANFVTYRTKDDTTSVFMGEASYTLERAADTLKIKHKRIILDLNSLSDQGRLTIIL